MAIQLTNETQITQSEVMFMWIAIIYHPKIILGVWQIKIRTWVFGIPCLFHHHQRQQEQHLIPKSQSHQHEWNLMKSLNQKTIEIQIEIGIENNFLTAIELLLAVSSESLFTATTRNSKMKMRDFKMIILISSYLMKGKPGNGFFHIINSSLSLKVLTEIHENELFNHKWNFDINNS